MCGSFLPPSCTIAQSYSPPINAAPGKFNLYPLFSMAFVNGPAPCAAFSAFVYTLWGFAY